MSNSIQVKKEVEMEIQVDHIKCQDCHDELDFEMTCDSYGDIQIAVERCKCEDNQQ